MLSGAHRVTADEPVGPITVGVTTSSGGRACPSPAEMVRKLATTLPDRRFVAAPTEGADVQLVDEGVRLRVVVEGSERGFVDPRRRCARRLRWASVFVALRLSSPPPARALAIEAPRSVSVDRAELPPPARDAPPPLPPPAGPIVSTAPSGASPAKAVGALVLAAGARLDTSVGGGLAPMTAGGAELRFSADFGRLGVGIGAAVLAPSELRTDYLRLRVLRAPLDVAVRATLLSYPRLRLIAELGPFVAGLVLDRTSGDSQRAVRAFGGLRLAGRFEARLWGPLWMHAVIEYQGIVIKTTIVVDEVGTAFDLPSHWLSFGAGLALRFP